MAEDIEIVPVHCPMRWTMFPKMPAKSARIIGLEISRLPQGRRRFGARQASDGRGRMFLKNCWYMGAWDHEVMDGKLLERRLLDQPVVFYRGESGQIVALDNRCCHRGAKLSQGRIEGDCARCMYHGLKFDQTGKCVQIPGQERIPPQLGVKSYPVVEKQHI